MSISKSKWLLATVVLSVALTGCSTADKNMAPEPAPAPAPAPPPPPPPPPSYIIEDVWFEFDSAKLKPTATDRLNDVARGLQGQQNVPYEVVGHTDSIGTEMYNQGLSEDRASSVNNYLVGAGVPGSQLSVKGMGESQPVAPNNTKEGRAKNRRVEIRPVN